MEWVEKVKMVMEKMTTAAKAKVTEQGWFHYSGSENDDTKPAGQNLLLLKQDEQRRAWYNNE